MRIYWVLRIVNFEENMAKELLYVNPETMKEVTFKQLPKVYQDALKKNTKGIKYIEEQNDGDEDAPRIYKSKEQKKLMETEDGKELAVYIRPASNGGCVDKKGKLIIEKDKRYDPNKSWRYPYGKQLVEIRKPKSHEFGKTKWKALYTKEYDVVHGTVKFTMIRNLADNIGEAKRQWQNGMLSKDDHRALCATMCAISNESPFRSGNKASATRKKNKTFGITTLKRKHVSLEEDKEGNEIISINFLGKGGEPIKKYIKNPIAVIKIKKLMKGKDPNDYLFTDDNGKTIDPTELNAYCKSIGVPHFHFFRHLRASQRFKEAVDKILESDILPDMPTAKEVSKTIVKAAEESAKLLGNQAATCIQNYIAPQLMFDVFKRYNLPIPDVYKNLAKLPSNVTKKDLEEIMQEKYYKNNDEDFDDEDEDEVDASATEEIEIVEPMFDDSKTTYFEDEKSRGDFDNYAIEYEYDDDDIINDPNSLKDIALSSVLIPTDFTINLDDITKYMMRREDDYKTDKNTEYDCRNNAPDVDKWGYNDYVGLTPEEMNKKWMQDAQQAIEMLTKGND